MSDVKHIMIVAGEASGDLHASRFVRELKQRHPHYNFSGVGGQHMQDAGVTLVSDLARYGVAGISEVIKHAGKIRQAFVALKAQKKTKKKKKKKKKNLKHPSPLLHQSSTMGLESQPHRHHSRVC